MSADILLGLGGVGLFLLGMVVLTEGLREVAGSALRRMLSQFTKTPLRGVIAGATTTAIIQSSSATTVTAVGFVGAGLLTFPQGLGIVLGANIGTTVTGWIVAIVGFKLKLGVAVLPLLLIGVLMRLFSRTRLRHLGWALAGFSMLFVGIDAMQEGLAPFEGVVTPDDFPGNSILGRLQLVLIGVLITIITQSSSAGVAAALVAMSTGTISFPQAAAMVIGMDVGTTMTAILATIGGSTATRQTGYAHVVYNVLTATLAFFLLVPFTAVVGPWIAEDGVGNGQIALVAFHTIFNIIGVCLVLPFTRPFARMILRLVPETGPPLLRRLDERLLRDSASAVDAAAATVRDIADVLIGILTGFLDPQNRKHFDHSRLAAVDEALETTRTFVEQIRTDPTDRHVHLRHLATMHALDHLFRLSHRCSQETRIEVLSTERRLNRLANVLYGALAELRSGNDTIAAEDRFNRLRTLLRKQRHRYRDRMVAAATEQRLSAYTTLYLLDSIRWLHRVAYHLWRILHHLNRAEEEMPAEPEAAERGLEVEED